MDPKQQTPPKLSYLQKDILGILQRHPGMHFLGTALAAMVKTTPRNLRSAIRSLRFAHGRWDILSRAGDDPATDGYWLSTDKREIAENRSYHQHYGLSHLARAGKMIPERSNPVANAGGQTFLFPMESLN